MAEFHHFHVISTQVHVLYIVWLLLSENQSYTRLPSQYGKFIARFIVLSFSLLCISRISTMFKVNVLTIPKSGTAETNKLDMIDNSSNNSTTTDEDETSIFYQIHQTFISARDEVKTEVMRVSGKLFTVNNENGAANKNFNATTLLPLFVSQLTIILIRNTWSPNPEEEEVGILFFSVVLICNYIHKLLVSVRIVETVHTVQCGTNGCNILLVPIYIYVLVLSIVATSIVHEDAWDLIFYANKNAVRQRLSKFVLKTYSVSLVVCFLYIFCRFVFYIFHQGFEKTTFAVIIHDLVLLFFSTFGYFLKYHVFFACENQWVEWFDILLGDEHLHIQSVITTLAIIPFFKFPYFLLNKYMHRKRDSHPDDEKQSLVEKSAQHAFSYTKQKNFKL